MPKGDKYLGLKHYLLNSEQNMVQLSFSQIEKIINDKLPSSAFKHSEAWWSNNKDHSQAVSWLEADYETDFVTDTYEKKYIIFVKRN